MKLGGRTGRCASVPGQSGLLFIAAGLSSLPGQATGPRAARSRRFVSYLPLIVFEGTAAGCLFFLLSLNSILSEISGEGKRV